MSKRISEITFLHIFLVPSHSPAPSATQSKLKMTEVNLFVILLFSVERSFTNTGCVYLIKNNYVFECMDYVPLFPNFQQNLLKFIELRNLWKQFYKLHERFGYSFDILENMLLIIPSTFYYDENKFVVMQDYISRRLDKHFWKKIKIGWKILKKEILE